MIKHFSVYMTLELQFEPKELKSGERADNIVKCKTLDVNKVKRFRRISAGNCLENEVRIKNSY